METFPVTVEDGVGLDGGAAGADIEDEDELSVGLGEAPAPLPPEAESELEVAIAAACDVADFPEASDEWPRPTATTAPAVPPAINTHPTENAAIVARLRPAPGEPTPGNVYP
ncbi:hypothetical protein [Catenulispora sp. GP43]|uniref:hypothetical protein n=1 Tax=Catenulispora sp. GP43 TaxID=3156263 RepID=UPI003518F070